ncbi:MAG: peptidase T, partial [Longicatena sp.]
IEMGLDVEMESVRGGTDGATLTFNGLPCPNLGTGGGNYHGRYEYCCIQEMEQAVSLIIKIAELVAGKE